MQKKKNIQLRLSDIAAIILCTSAMAVSLYFFYGNINKEFVKNAEDQIAVISFKYRSAQRKFSDGVIWDKLRNNSAVYNGDTIRTATSSEATVFFDNGNVLDLHENTLAQIYTKKKDGEISILFDRGNISLQTGTNTDRVIIESKKGNVIIESKSSLSVSINNSIQKVQVIEGNVQVVSDNKAVVLYAGEVIETAEDSVMLEQPSAAMIEPIQNYRYLNHTGSVTNIVFRWKTSNMPPDAKLYLNLYTDKRYTMQYASYDVTNWEEFDIPLPNGKFYWRLLPVLQDSSIKTRYDSGQLLILDAPSPTVIAPKNSEFTYKNEVPQIRFSWKGNDWVSLYQVEVADNIEMLNPIAVKTSQSESCYISGLTDGEWFWRVIPVYTIQKTDEAFSSEIYSFTIKKHQIETKEGIVAKIEVINEADIDNEEIPITDEEVKVQGNKKESAGTELLYINDFVQARASWEANQGESADLIMDFSSGSFKLNGGPRGKYPWDVSIVRKELSLKKNMIYELSFDASSTSPTDTIQVCLQEYDKDIDGDGDYWTLWSAIDIALSKEPKKYRAKLVTKEYDDQGGALRFNFGGTTSGTISIDNISLKETESYLPEENELIYNGSFNACSNFWLVNQLEGADAKLDFSSGALVLKGGLRGLHEWSIDLVQGEQNFSKYSIYELSFDASSTSPSDLIRIGLQEFNDDADGDGNAYSYWSSEVFTLSTEFKTYKAKLATREFDCPSGGLYINLGATEGTLKIDNISLKKAGTWKPDPSKIINNGNFELGSALWDYWQSENSSANMDFSSGAFVLSGGLRGIDEFNMCLGKLSLDLPQYSIYKLTFDASSTSASDVLKVGLQSISDYINDEGENFPYWSWAEFSLSTEPAVYTATLISSEFGDTEGSLIFPLGLCKGTITIDNVSLKKTGSWQPKIPEMVFNGDFELGNNYWNTWSGVTNKSGVGSFSDGKFTLTETQRGTENWVIQLSTNGYFTYKRGETYSVTFNAASTESEQITLNAGEDGFDVNGDGNIWSAWASKDYVLTSQMTAYTLVFTMSNTFEDPQGRLNFCLGNTKGIITIDNVSVKPVQ
ncbi:MAG TPA: carbohydrate binding domain-containing protein [Treponemataceae bacterium]|jgi:hypothetical protein|nr:carbohydrate binding domain-containing protein [Treponemataceae bacterium]